MVTVITLQLHWTTWLTCSCREHPISVQFSSVYLATINYEIQYIKKKKPITWQGSPEETIRLTGPGPPRYIEEYKNRKSLHGLMDYIDYTIKLPLNIRLCLPHFTLATRTIRLDCLIKLSLNITRCSPYFMLVTRTKRGRQNQIKNMTKDSF